MATRGGGLRFGELVGWLILLGILGTAGWYGWKAWDHYNRGWAQGAKDGIRFVQLARTNNWRKGTFDQELDKFSKTAQTRMDTKTWLGKLYVQGWEEGVQAETSKIPK